MKTRRCLRFRRYYIRPKYAVPYSFPLCRLPTEHHRMALRYRKAGFLQMRKRRSKRASCLLHAYLSITTSIIPVVPPPLLCLVSSTAVISATSLVYSTRESQNTSFLISARFTDKLSQLKNRTLALLARGKPLCLSASTFYWFTF